MLKYLIKKLNQWRWKRIERIADPDERFAAKMRYWNRIANPRRSLG